MIDDCGLNSRRPAIEAMGWDVGPEFSPNGTGACAGRFRRDDRILCSAGSEVLLPPRGDITADLRVRRLFSGPILGSS